MKRIKLNIPVVLLSFLLVFSAEAQAAVVGEAIEYQHGTDLLEGYLAYDDAVQGRRPGVLVVHEWKGLDKYAKSRAEQLAGLGYVALAVDMYGKGVRAQDHAEAGKLAGIYKSDRSLMRERARAGYDLLKSYVLTDPERMAAIGYCFGGTTVLEMARAGFDLKGVASFHGGLSTPVPAGLGDIKTKMIVFHGAEDPFISAEEVKNFQDEMQNAGADWQFVALDGAVHSFTVPYAGTDKSKGAAYHEEADKQSWAQLLQFFNEIFK
jgi:dienelactone hydrolase